MPGNARHSLGDIVSPNGRKGKPFVAQGGSPALLHFSLFTCPSRECSAGLAVLRFPRRKPAPQPGTLRWAPFLSDEKEGKESPKAGPSPALWNPPRGTGCPCVLLVSALGPVGSHRWHGNSTERACFSGTLYFNCQGLTLVCNCSQLPEAWLPVTA